jgi:hypothetical protein
MQQTVVEERAIRIGRTADPKTGRTADDTGNGRLYGRGMTTHAQLNWLRIATGLVLAGAVAWLVKFGIIVTMETTDGNIGTAVFFLTGFVLLLLGAAALGVWLARKLHVVLRVVAGLIGAAVFFMSMNWIDTGAKSVIGDLGPDYITDEWGILAAAITWLLVGLAAVQRSRA